MKNLVTTILTIFAIVQGMNYLGTKSPIGEWQDNFEYVENRLERSLQAE